MATVVHPVVARTASLAQLIAGIVGPQAKRVLLVSSRGRREQGEAADYIAHLLRAARVDVMPWTATAHGEFAPTAQKVCEGVDLVQRFGCDGVVAVGGGTVIDTAKIVASACTNPALLLAMKGAGSPADFMEIMSGRTISEASLPMFAAPTLFGAGSEVSASATVLAEFESEFFELRSPLLAPRAALIDASLARSAAAGVRRTGAITALSHCIAKAVRGGDAADEALRGVSCAAAALRGCSRGGDANDADDELIATAAACGEGGGSSVGGTVGAVVHAVRHQAPVPYAAATAVALVPMLRAELQRPRAGDGVGGSDSGGDDADANARRARYEDVLNALGGGGGDLEGGVAGALISCVEELCSGAGAAECTWDTLGVTDEQLAAAATEAVKSPALLEAALFDVDVVRDSLACPQ